MKTPYFQVAPKPWLDRELAALYRANGEPVPEHLKPPREGADRKEKTKCT